MKNKFLILIYIMIVISFLVIDGVTVEKISERPNSVSENAIWKEHSSIWSIGSFDAGNKILWYKDGTYLYREFLIKKNLKKSIRYHENGKIHQIGQWQYFKDKYYDNDGNLIGWIEFGKWKEYDTEGNLIHEWCKTPNYIGGEDPHICGEEIFYNKDGSIKHKIKHKYECQYGCEELECKDCIK